MKIKVIVFTFLFILAKLEAQQLSINEVVDYLSTLTDKYPYNNSDDSIRTYYRFKYGEFFSFKYLTLIKVTEYLQPTGNITRRYDSTKSIDLDRFTTIPISQTKGNFTCYSTLILDSRLRPHAAAWERDAGDANSKITLVVPCYLEDLLNIYYRGIRHIVSMLSEKREKIYIQDPFSDKGLIASNLSISLTRAGNLFTIVGVVNLQPIEFIFDSGASDCSLNESTFSRVYNKFDTSSFRKLPDGLYKMADGSIKSQSRYLLRGIMINNQLVQDIRITVSPDGSPNLLGNSFLKHFSSWSLDQKNLILTLKR
jgi:clan AA aspartic protease (TIGR02281 family)